MTRQDRGFKKWQELAEMLNEQIQLQGKIKKDNKVIWDQYLHKWDNNDWLDVLSAIMLVQDEFPQHFKRFQDTAFAEAATILVEQGSTHSRVLDTRPHKEVTWKFIMSAREVWNEFAEYEIKKPQIFYQ